MSPSLSLQKALLPTRFDAIFPDETIAKKDFQMETAFSLSYYYLFLGKTIFGFSHDSVTYLSAKGFIGLIERHTDKSALHGKKMFPAFWIAVTINVDSRP